MAERQQVNRWIRALLGLTAAGGIAAIALALNGIITIDGGAAGDLRISASAISKENGSADLTFSTASVAQDLNFYSTDDVIVDAADLVSIFGGTGGVNGFTASNAGAFITALDPGDDASIQAADTIGLTAPTAITLYSTLVQAPIDGSSGTTTAYPFQQRLEFDYVNAAPGSTAEASLALQALPISALNINGDGAFIEAWGITAGNANAKTVRVRIGASGSGTGGTAVATCNFASANDTQWYLQAFVYRSASGAQRSRVWCQGMTTAGTAGTTLRDNTLTAAITDTAIIDLNLTVQNATAAGDLTVHAVRWAWL